MPFGLTQLFEKTPKKLVILGHALLIVAAAAQENDIAAILPNLSHAITVGGIAGAFLTTLFGEKKSNNYLKK